MATQWFSQKKIIDQFSLPFHPAIKALNPGSEPDRDNGYLDSKKVNTFTYLSSGLL
jgi:hypothetical protein